MAEGFDDFEMEEFRNKFPDYDETFEEVDNADDLEGLLDDYGTKYDNLLDIYNKERSPDGKRYKKNRLAYEKIGEKIKYARWLRGTREHELSFKDDGKTVTITSGDNTSIEVSRVESVLDSTGMRILMRGRVSELKKLFTDDGRIDGRKTKEFKEFKQFLTRYLEKVFRLNGPLLIDLNTSKEIIAKTRFENVGKTQEENRAITLIYNGEEVVSLKVQSRPYNFEVINENLFKRNYGHY